MVSGHSLIDPFFFFFVVLRWLDASLFFLHHRSFQGVFLFPTFIPLQTPFVPSNSHPPFGFLISPVFPFPSLWAFFFFNGEWVFNLCPHSWWLAFRLLPETSPSLEIAYLNGLF